MRKSILFSSSLVAGVLLLLAPSPANAANCSTDYCTTARIQSVLISWDAVNADPYTVKIRFDALTNLGCNFYGGAYNEVLLWSNDPAFDTKYNALMTAYTLGKPITFYVKSSSPAALCEFRTIVLN